MEMIEISIEPSVRGQYALIHLKKGSMKLWSINFVSSHSFGTLTLEAGNPIESFAKMMEHASISSTQIYAQITDQKIARDMERLVQQGG